jgi:hypothetical protein
MLLTNLHLSATGDFKSALYYGAGGHILSGTGVKVSGNKKCSDWLAGPYAYSITLRCALHGLKRLTYFTVKFAEN